MADTPADDRTLRGDATPLPDSHHVDIAQAEAQFNELQRVLSIRSQQADSERTQSAHEKDVEKGEPHEEFDLRSYLTSTTEAADRAGLAHKHVGVTWEDLSVEGVGGIGHKVGASSQPHAVMYCVSLDLGNRSMLLHSDVRELLSPCECSTQATAFTEDALGFWTSPYRIARRVVEAIVPAARPKLPLMTILQPYVSSITFPEPFG